MSGTLGPMLGPVAVTGGLNEADLVQLMKNAFEGSWATSAQRVAFCRRLDGYMREWLAARPGATSVKPSQPARSA